MPGQTPNPTPRQEPKTRLPQFVVPQESWAGGFFSRLKSYLTERPGKLPRTTGPAAFNTLAFQSSFTENLKDWLKGTPRAARMPVANSRMIVETKPWYAIFWENLRDTIAPRKLPPLHLTSKPVKVRDIWSKNEEIRRAQAVSLVVHAAIVILLVAPFWHQFANKTSAAPKPQLVPIDISPYLAKLPAGDKKAGGGGGGGERLETPASKGRIPKFSMKPQLTPPVAVLRNPKPALPVEPTLFGPPEIKIATNNLPNYGDPLASMATNSSGPGSGGGIGTGSGGGIGSGTGGGLGPGSGGGTGGGVFQAGRDGVGIPACVYCPNPTFSDEAVKARYQGTAVLRVVVTTEGRVTNISVVRGLGLGLDERAIETVKTWQLKPARGPNGQIVPVQMLVEVVFRQH